MSLPAREPATPLEPVIDPAGWTASDFREEPPWVLRLTPAEVDDILAAVAAVEARGQALVTIRKPDFALHDAAGLMARIYGTLTDGVGFVQLRGLPVARMTRRQAAIAFLGMGAWFGEPTSQNAAGHVLGHVKDLGFDYNDPAARGYQTAAAMGFHSDPCDFVALLCLKTAKAGGASRIVSSVTLYNEMLRRRPDLAAEMVADFYWTRHGEVSPGEDPFYRMPVFSFVDGWFSGRGVSSHIQKAQALPGVPPFTERQTAAIALFRELARELAVDVPFEEGDFQILSNHVMLHSRREFEDWPARVDKRHLLRLWLIDPGCRPVPALVREGYKGIKVAGYVPKAPLEAEADAA